MYFTIAKTIATALFSSRFNYCNSIYYIALKDVLKLQRVQNCLARVVTWSPRFSHSALIRKSLHWLPVRCGIIFRYVKLIKHFHPINQHNTIHCSLLQDSLGSFDHLILIYVLFPVLRQMSEPGIFQSVGNITTFPRKLKTTCLNLFIFHNTPPPSPSIQIQLFTTGTAYRL